MQPMPILQRNPSQRQYPDKFLLQSSGSALHQWLFQPERTSENARFSWIWSCLFWYSTIENITCMVSEEKVMQLPGPAVISRLFLLYFVFICLTISIYSGIIILLLNLCHPKREITRCLSLYEVRMYRASAALCLLAFLFAASAAR